MKVVIFTYQNISHYKLIEKLAVEIADIENEVYLYVGDNYKVPELIQKNERIKILVYDKAIEEECKREKLEFEKLIDYRTMRFDSENEIEKYIIAQTEFFINCFKIYSNTIIDEVKDISPDLILSDICSYHGVIISNQLNIKNISYATNILCNNEYIKKNVLKVIPAIFNLDMKFLDENNILNFYTHMENEVNLLAKRKGIERFPLIYTLMPNSEKTIIFSSSYLQPELDNNKYYLTKPIVFERDRYVVDNSVKNIIYVATGSQIVAPLKFYENIINWANGKKFEVIISCKYDLSKYINIPSNVKIFEYVDQEEILKKCMLFITHGGYNSIYESIYHEVPILVYPLVNDQPLNAMLVEKCGIGVNLKKYKLNIKNLDKITSMLINNEDVNKNIQIVKDSYYQLYSLKELAKIISEKGLE